jgi:putative ABC transport system substrate-binding protein
MAKIISVSSRVRRREFIAGLAGAVACPLTSRAQQPAFPVVGYLSPGPPEPNEAEAFRRGLREAGFIEGRNVEVEYRWAENDWSRVPVLANELVSRRASAILAMSPIATLALKAKTSSIPIVFIVSEDPVDAGLVASLRRPGGNVTGFTDFGNQLAAKSVEILADTLLRGGLLAMLVNPANPNAAGTQRMFRQQRTREPFR